MPRHRQPSKELFFFVFVFFNSCFPTRGSRCDLERLALIHTHTPTPSSLLAVVPLPAPLRLHRCREQSISCSAAAPLWRRLYGNRTSLVWPAIKAAELLFNSYVITRSVISFIFLLRAFFFLSGQKKQLGGLVRLGEGTGWARSLSCRRRCCSLWRHKGLAIP